jgi:hypothetical protein
MKYSPAPLTPSPATLPQNVPLCSRCHSLVSIPLNVLSACTSIACALLNSLASLFATPLLCFQSFADSFAKTRGWWMGVPCAFFSFTPIFEGPLVYPERSSRGATPFLLAFVFKNLQIPRCACRPRRSLFSVSCESLGGQALSFHIDTNCPGVTLSKPSLCSLCPRWSLC